MKTSSIIVPRRVAAAIPRAAVAACAVAAVMVTVVSAFAQQTGPRQTGVSPSAPARYDALQQASYELPDVPPPAGAGAALPGQLLPLGLAERSARQAALRENAGSETTARSQATGKPRSGAPGPALPPPPERASSRPVSGGAVPTLGTGLGALAIVLGLFFLLVWILRRVQPRGAGQLPREVVEVLGRTPLAPRQVAQLIRLGNKLVLVAVSAGEIRTLAEVTEAAEVQRLVRICQQPSSFRQVFEQWAGEPNDTAAPLSIELDEPAAGTSEPLAYGKSHV